MEMRSPLLAICLLTAAACASSGGGPSSAPPDSALRPSRDVPVFFEARGESAAGRGTDCRSPLFDPRDDGQIVLVRSAGGKGDYEVPAGRYGVGVGDLLRVECGSGRPLGVVAR